MYICIYAYFASNVCIYAYYMYICMYAYTHICIYAYMHTYMQVESRRHVRVVGWGGREAIRINPRVCSLCIVYAFCTGPSESLCRVLILSMFFVQVSSLNHI